MGTAGGVALVWVCTKWLPPFNDKTTSWYVAEPVGILVLSGLICFTVAYGFLNVYDMVADTILYCKVNEEVRRRKGTLPSGARYAPRKLDELVRGGDDF